MFVFGVNFSVLGLMATSAPVLYANTNHPELKAEYPNWTDRYKQIIKRWRALSVEIKTPYNASARENRSKLRMKKTQQVSEGLLGTANRRDKLGMGNDEGIRCRNFTNSHTYRREFGIKFLFV